MTLAAETLRDVRDAARAAGEPLDVTRAADAAVLLYCVRHTWLGWFTLDGPHLRELRSSRGIRAFRARRAADLLIRLDLVDHEMTPVGLRLLRREEATVR